MPSAPFLVDRLLTVGFALAVIAVAAQTVGHLTNAFVLDYEIWNLDADQDGNALSWASSVATFSVGLGAFLLGLLAPTPIWRLLALAAILAFFSVDDVVGIHERLASETVHGLDLRESFGRALWPLLYFPLLGFAVLALWRLAAESEARIRRAILLGLGLLAVAVAAEATSVLWWSDQAGRPLADDLEVAIEEGAELGGWIILAAALGGILVSRLSPSVDGPSRRIS